MNEKDLAAALAEELHRIAPDIDLADIDREADLREQFDIDSMDFLNLVTALHKRYGLPIPQTDYPRLATFAKAVAYLMEKARWGPEARGRPPRSGRLGALPRIPDEIHLGLHFGRRGRGQQADQNGRQEADGYAENPGRDGADGPPGLFRVAAEEGVGAHHVVEGHPQAGEHAGHGPRPVGTLPENAQDEGREEGGGREREG